MTMTKFEYTTETGDWKTETLEQMEYQYRAAFRPRVEGLTDDEYFWEPAPGCWSIRRREEATSPMAAGKGDYVIDFEIPEPRPAPLTTIAWRLVHIAEVFGARTANHFGDANPTIHARFSGNWWEKLEMPSTANDALALVDEAHTAWVDGVRSLDNDAMWRAVGPVEGPYQDYSFAALVLHINREFIHHGAEVCLLRDLYRAQHG